MCRCSVEVVDFSLCICVYGATDLSKVSDFLFWFLYCLCCVEEVELCHVGSLEWDGEYFFSEVFDFCSYDGSVQWVCKVVGVDVHDNAYFGSEFFA